MVKNWVSDRLDDTVVSCGSDFVVTGIYERLAMVGVHLASAQKSLYHVHLAVKVIRGRGQ